MGRKRELESLKWKFRFQMLMEEDFQDISAESNMLEELSEMTIDNEKLHRSNPVFDADRPSSKVEISFVSTRFHYSIFCTTFRFQFDAILNTIMTKVIDRQEKAVVVSQFTSVLRLFEDHLSRKDVKFLVLNGSTKISHRQNIVRSFNEDPDEQVPSVIHEFHLLPSFYLTFYEDSATFIDRWWRWFEFVWSE